MAPRASSPIVPCQSDRSEEGFNLTCDAQIVEGVTAGTHRLLKAAHTVLSCTGGHLTEP